MTQIIRLFRLTLTHVPASVGSPNNLRKTSLQWAMKIRLFKSNWKY